MSAEPLKKVIIGSKAIVKRLCPQQIEALNDEDSDAVMVFLNYDPPIPFEELPVNAHRPGFSRHNLAEVNGPFHKKINQILEADDIFIAADTIEHGRTDEGKKPLNPEVFVLPLLTRLNLNNKKMDKSRVHILGPKGKKSSVNIYLDQNAISYTYSSDFDQFNEKFQEINGNKQMDKALVLNSHASRATSMLPTIGLFASAGVSLTVGILVATSVLPLTPLVVALIVASSIAALLCLIIAANKNPTAQPQRLFN